MESSQGSCSGTTIITIHLVGSSTIRNITNSVLQGTVTNEQQENKLATEIASQQGDTAF